MAVQGTSRVVRIGLAAVVCALAAFYTVAAARVFAAHEEGASPDEARVRRAAALQPGNAEYRCRLGRMLFPQDAAAGRRELETAVALNPRDPWCWFELATASQVLGDTRRRDAAIDAALRADPKTAQVLWQVASFNLIRGNVSDALRQLRVSVEYDDTSIVTGLELALRATRNPDLILREVLPPQLTPHFAMLGMMLHAGDLPRAAAVWTAVNRLPTPFAVDSGNMYFNYLLENRRGDELAAAWDTFTAAQAAYRAYQRDPGNLIVNGSFEHDILNAGLDWHYEAMPFAHAAIDDGSAAEGTRSLAITYEGTAQDAGVWLPVPVKPDTSYVLSVRARSELEGVHGPRLVLDDAGRRVLESDEINGTADWHAVTAEFRTGPDTRLLRLRLLRLSDVTQLRGRLWLDGFRLAPKEAR